MRKKGWRRAGRAAVSSSCQFTLLGQVQVLGSRKAGDTVSGPF